jgi:hypothetical protein
MPYLKMKIKLPALTLAALLFAGLPLASSSAYVAVSVGIAPPAIPIYEQPYCPTPGYIWTPGYWDWADFGYYWVPGVWVAPPRIGFLWTPGYWGYYGGRYRFNQGYWGPNVGYYGGINYGFGYGGSGYYGGEWAGNTFRYNTAVTRVNTSMIHNTYVNRNVVRNTGSRAGFNGPGGAQAKPTAREQAAAKTKHIPPTSAQRSRVEAAKKDPALHAKNNKGKPNSEAVKALDRKNGRQAAPATKGPAATQKRADAGKHAGAQEQANRSKRANSEKAKGGTAQAANRSHPPAHAAPQHTRQPAHVNENSRTNKKVATPQARHAQPQPVAHRPPTRVRQAPAAAGRGAPARTEQPGKKKKKKEKPDGR